jgi:hypothetical protein
MRAMFPGSRLWTRLWRSLERLGHRETGIACSHPQPHQGLIRDIRPGTANNMTPCSQFDPALLRQPSLVTCGKIFIGLIDMPIVREALQGEQDTGLAYCPSLLCLLDTTCPSEALFSAPVL